MLSEIVAVTRVNLATIPGRIAGSAIIVIGIAGVVAVLLGLLAMSNGFVATLADTAHADRGLIVRNGANNELSGWVTNEELAVLRSFEGLGVVSGELYVTINAHTREGTAVDVVGRGVTDAAFELRPELEIVAGRALEPGKAEAIVGIRAAAEHTGLALGDVVPARGTPMTVVGHFAAAGSPAESEIWLDLPVAGDAFRREVVSLARVAFEPGKVDELAARIDADPRLPFTLVPETQFFAAQSTDRAALIDTFAYLVAGIMALGAVIAALNTLHTAVSRRTKEIAILRALGFRRTGIVVSVLTEAMLLAALGGLIGAGVVYLLFDGYAMTTHNDAAGAQLAFAFRVSPALVATGLSWALALGLIGGLAPALHAARMPIARAFRRG
jgi:putative ABC transport system permease protein